VGWIVVDRGVAGGSSSVIDVGGCLPGKCAAVGLVWLIWCGLVGVWSGDISMCFLYLRLNMKKPPHRFR
jgi:hypothetical protein